MSHVRPVVAPEDRSLWTDLDNFGWRLAAAFAVTLAWLFAGFCASIAYGHGGGWFIFFLALAVLVLAHVGPQPWRGYAFRVAPLVGDWHRFQTRSRIEDGRRASVALGLAREDTDLSAYRAQFFPIRDGQPGWLTIQGTLPVLSSTEQMAKAVESRTAAVGAQSFRLTRQGVGNWKIDLFPGDRPDPLPGVRHALLLPATRFPIGRTENGDAVLNIEDASHVAIQGMTRSGKSALLYTILGTLAGDPRVRVGGIDPNGITLGPFADAAPGWVSTTSDPAEAVAVLRRYVDEMTARIGVLLSEGIEKIDTFNPDRPLLVCVLEEYPGLLGAADADRKVKAEIQTLVGRLVREGAKAGIRVILLAQRMDASIVGGDIRAQFGTRITMRVDNLDAVTMLHPGAADLDISRIKTFPPGRALFEVHGHMNEMQADFTEYRTYRAVTSDRLAPDQPADDQPADDAGHEAGHDGG